MDTLERGSFIASEEVQSFVDYFARLLTGAERLQHTLRVSDPGLPIAHAAYGTKTICIASLKDAFDSYWWAGGGYQSNLIILSDVQRVVRAAIQLEHVAGSDAATAALNAIDEVLAWGAGGRRGALYAKNLAWAKNNFAILPASLRLGRNAMQSDHPDLTLFGKKRTGLYARMNAGFTKYYALACDDVIIYDGRVGAALGYLVRLFCQRDGRRSVPMCLRFRWGAGRSQRKRDPSDQHFQFPQLSSNSENLWAESNVRANWILRAAIEKATLTGPAWCSGVEGLRRVEAALFVIGYEIDGLVN
jgi:hypothetical protein